MTDRTSSAAPGLCFHQSEPSDQGVFRCTKPKGHDGPHQSAQAHWWSDPEPVAAIAPGFKITGGKGFHVTFENGWTVSVQFGPGNYTGNYHEPFAKLLGDSEYVLPASATAEIAAWGPDGNWHNFGDDTVAGCKTAADVLAFMQEIAAK